VETTADLQQLRTDIDVATQRLIVLLNERAVIAQHIGAAKGNGPIYDPAREVHVLQRVIADNKGPLSNDALQAIFREIIGACRNLEQQLTVVFLGPAGTYSEQAARKHLGTTCAFEPVASLDEALQLVEKGSAHLAVVPIENSTEGTVNRTLDLLATTKVQVCGEVFLPIRHQLLTHAASLQAITEVLAHPQALAQCRIWLDAHLPQAARVAVPSNAEAARQAGEDDHKAAIASTRAGDIYNLPTLAPNIEDASSNTTRFLVLGRQDARPTGQDKTSLLCSVPNIPGSLGRLLAVFADAQINVTKLESRPVRHAPWDYIFFMDIDGHREDPEIAQALALLQERASLVKILGSYPKGGSA
jgi:chorismate mutase/prephenate dehydratase